MIKNSFKKYFSFKQTYERIKNIGKNVILTSTCHGLPSITRTDLTILKGLWTVSVLIASIFCGYFIIKSVNEYFEYDYFTKTTIIQERPMPFPALTICDSYSANQSNVSFVLEESLFYCKYNSMHECNVNSFEPLELYVNGDAYKCYRLNGGQNISGSQIELIKSNRIGNMYGLLIGFYAPQLNFITYSITNNSIYPTMPEVFNRHAKPNTFTEILIKKLLEIKLGKPYNQCLDKESRIESVLFRKTVEKYAIYRQINCYDICIQTYVSSFCNINVTNNCTINVYNDFDYEENCSKQCPIECEITSFGLSEKVYQYTVPDSEILYKEELIKLLNDSNITNKSDVELNQKIIWLLIYYEDLSYTQIIQIPKMTLPDLVSNVGGILGVFLGISLLSFVEILEFLVEVLLILRKKSKINAK